MAYVSDRKNIALAYQMKREKLAQLQAELRIAQNLAFAAQKDIEELSRLEGSNLVAAMFWESPDEVLAPKKAYFQQLENAVTGGLA